MESGSKSPTQAWAEEAWSHLEDHIGGPVGQAAAVVLVAVGAIGPAVAKALIAAAAAAEAGEHAAWPP